MLKRVIGFFRTFVIMLVILLTVFLVFGLSLGNTSWLITPNEDKEIMIAGLLSYSAICSLILEAIDYISEQNTSGGNEK